MATTRITPEVARYILEAKGYQVTDMVRVEVGPNGRPRRRRRTPHLLAIKDNAPMCLEFVARDPSRISMGTQRRISFFGELLATYAVHSFEDLLRVIGEPYGEPGAYSEPGPEPGEPGEPGGYSEPGESGEPGEPGEPGGSGESGESA